MKVEIYEERLSYALRKSEMVEHIMLDAILEECDESTIRSLTSIPLKISYDSKGIFFLDKNNDRIECPNFSTNISIDGEWLSDKLPDVPFDVEQAGNIRKSIEAESAYCCCIVSLVLHDDSFIKELDEVIKNYDFVEMGSKDGNKNFKELLTSWQDIQSTVINVCVSAAKYKISNLKKRYREVLERWHSRRFGHRIAKPGYYH